MDADRVGEMERRLDLMEERMNTRQAEYKTDIALLAKQIAERDRNLLIAIVAVVALAVAIFKGWL